MTKAIIICNGSNMEDLDIDIFDWCGLGHLDDEEQDKFFWNNTALNVFQNCTNIEYEVTGETDIVRYSDVFYEFYTFDLQAAKDEVKKEIEITLKES